MINVNCLNNIAACGLKLFSDEYNTEIGRASCRERVSSPV